MTATQQQEFDALAQHAKLAGQARDWQGARQAWMKALELLPPDSEEYRLTKTRVENIDLQLSDKSAWKKRFAKLGPIGTFLVVALSKGKLLLLGLTKLSTLASMLAFFAVYWTIFGWRFAVGLRAVHLHPRDGTRDGAPQVQHRGQRADVHSFRRRDCENAAVSARCGRRRARGPRWSHLGIGFRGGGVARRDHHRPSHLVCDRAHRRMAEFVQPSSRSGSWMAGAVFVRSPESSVALQRPPRLRCGL